MGPADKDTISGSGGNDLVCGGRKDDRIQGGLGQDGLFSGESLYIGTGLFSRASLSRGEGTALFGIDTLAEAERAEAEGLLRRIR